MKEILSPEKIQEITGGKWTKMPEKPIESVQYIIDDETTAKANFIFIPEIFDSHLGDDRIRVSAEAFEKGASACMVTKVTNNLIAEKHPFLVVKNIHESITKLAEYQKANSQAKTTMIVGSVGKSTTRMISAHMLQNLGDTFQNFMNYNNGYAAQMNMMQLTQDYKYCVMEVALARNVKSAELIKPDVAIITAIDKEHIPDFEKPGDTMHDVLQKIAERKSAVLEHVKPGGTVVLNKDNEFYDYLVSRAKHFGIKNICSFGRDDKADVQIISSKKTINGSEVELSIDGKKYNYFISIPGEHNIYNSTAAIAACFALGADLEQILPSLSGFELDRLWGEEEKADWKDGQISLLDFNINSKLPGLYSLLEHLSLMKVEHPNKKIAVLGSTPYLGSFMKEEMVKLAHEAEKTDIDKFYTIGDELKIFNDHFTDRNRIYPHNYYVEEIYNSLLTNLNAKDIIVLKSTRKPANISLRRLAAMVKSEPAKFSNFDMLGLLSQDKIQILKIAENAIYANLDMPLPHDVSEDITLDNSGIFVSVYVDGQMRGCMGSLFPVDDTIEALKKNAVDAASGDSRYDPVYRTELGKMDIEIYFLRNHLLLETNEPIEIIDLLEEKRCGVIVKDMDRMATYLPHVWESYSNPSDFMVDLCEKAGLAANAWLRGAEIYTYTTENFKKSELEDRY